MQFSITSKCNRKCPYCTQGTNFNDHQYDNDYSYLDEMEPYFQDMEEIVIFGGEPTCHFDFYNYVASIKAIFAPKKYTIWTNGYKFKGNELAFDLFDQVIVSEYSCNTYKNCPNNKDICDYIRSVITDDRLIVGKVTHEKLVGNGYNNPCERLDIGPLLYEGKLYTCCTGAGLNIYNCIVPSDTWREDILKLKQDCHLCPWAEE